MRYLKITENLFLNELAQKNPEDILFNVFLEISLIDKKFKFKKKKINQDKKIFFLSSKPYPNSQEVEIFQNDILRPSKKYIFTCAIYAFTFYFIKNKNTLFKKFAEKVGENNFDVKQIKNSIFDRKYRLNEK
jgi:hypothetical protein